MSHLLKASAFLSIGAVGLAVGAQSLQKTGPPAAEKEASASLAATTADRAESVAAVQAAAPVEADRKGDTSAGTSDPWFICRDGRLPRRLTLTGH